MVNVRSELSALLFNFRYPICMLLIAYGFCLVFLPILGMLNGNNCVELFTKALREPRNGYTSHSGNGHGNRLNNIRPVAEEALFQPGVKNLRLPSANILSSEVGGYNAHGFGKRSAKIE